MDEDKEKFILDTLKKATNNEFLTPFHKHTGVDSPTLGVQAVFPNAPLSGLTAQSGGLTSGGTANLKTSDANTIINTINRVNEIENRLKNLGLIS